MTGEHTPSPIPGPKPGPRPGPRPTPGPARGVNPAPVPAAATDPSKFGRIDEDGTVYVTTADGERAIGSWQAGTIEEGLAHYGQRYDDLATEVELLETRIGAHPEEAKKLAAQAEALRDTLPTAAVIGDLERLGTRLAAVIDHAHSAEEKAAQDKISRREKAIARKEELAAEAEDLAENSTEWKTSGDRIRAILDEWRTIRGIDRATDDALWKRYSRARDSFNRRRGAHFAELDRGRASAKAKKEALIEQAEALQDSTQWRETAQRYRELMTEWKAAGRAQRSDDDKLWARFRAAQDHFFAARDADIAARDHEFEANAAAKDALIAEFDAQIDPSSNIDQARAKLRELQEKWEEIGFVPRNRVREYEDKISALESRVADAEKAQWRRTDPAVQARVAQFEAKVADFTQRAEKAESQGKESEAAELRAQAAQWEQFAEAARNAVDN
ncbi:DUF349 domain-containing protein [Corynebacterium uterequi]|uniref:Putative DUF349 family protein n=1 Tax=Corynebacterium uterequi TaxID=1072256 RepID=A0A0G3HEZ1_9CORY|nr:DUF349 domain-containing protein [Corynebacterium uterequi]AKK11295.1 putative DUF349 family protein [Corynebacterium uterequi]